MASVSCYLSRACLVLSLLVAMAGVRPAPAQDFDWLDEDLPEFVEDFGYEDADYDGPDLGVEAGARDGDCIRCRKELFGDCLGCRSHFQESGITYRGKLTQYFFGFNGGIPGAGDQFEYTGNSQNDFLFDLEKLGGPKAGRFVFSLENLFGEFGNISFRTGATAPPVLNSIFPTDPEANGVPRVTNMLYMQPVSERLILGVGKARMLGIADNNVFAGGDGSDQFLNMTFSANPLFASQLPYSTFAVSAIMPREWGNMMIHFVDPKDRSTDFFDLGDLFSQGFMMFGQIKVNTNFFCKPGEHHIGGYYKNVDLPDIRFSPRPPNYPYPPATPGVPTKPETYTIWYGFDQYVAVLGTPNAKGETVGWGIFGRAGISDGGVGNPNFNAWHVSGGIGGDSPLRCRLGKGDRFGIGYGYTGTSNAWGPIPISLFGPRDLQAFEAYYRYQVTPAISISPDVQWVKGLKGGLTGGDDAFVYGLRMNMKL